MSARAKSLWLDRAAIGFSAVCVVHCLALPLLLILIPTLATLPIADERFHLLLVFLVLPTSVLALFIGYRRHQDRAVLYWGITGVTLLVLTAMLGHDLLGDTGERLLTVLGAVLVAVGHIRNFRLRRPLASAT